MIYEFHVSLWCLHVHADTIYTLVYILYLHHTVGVFT